MRSLLLASAAALVLSWALASTAPATADTVPPATVPPAAEAGPSPGADPSSPQADPSSPQANPSSPQAKPSADARSPADSKTLDELYDRLAKARNDDEARGIVGAIQRRQARSGSDTADLLMVRAMSAFQAGDVDLTIRLLSATIKLQPDFTEAWNRRATAYYRKNDFVRSIADIAQTLQRDPRHFGAWAGLGMILRETGDKRRAYEAFQKALAINPRLDDVKKALDDLKPDVEGRDI